MVNMEFHFDNLNVPNFHMAFNCEFKYINNKEVICTLRPKSNLDYLGYEPYVKNLVYTGKAVFKEGDTFDIRVGETIARKKAMRAYYKDMVRFYKAIWENFMKYTAERLAYIEQIEAKASEMTVEILEMTRT